jgi:flagellar protein FlbD
MVHLTRLNATPLFLNSDLIEYIQATPDTLITLTNGNNLIVREAPEEIISRIVNFRRRIAHDGPRIERHQSGHSSVAEESNGQS